jgi:hypothetical protein
MRTNRTQLALVCVPVVLAAAAIITAVVLYISGPRRPMASQADCDRIEVGMTRAQVEHVLGGPPGDYRTPDADNTLFVDFRHGNWYEWHGDGGHIFVKYDKDGQVIDKLQFDPPSPRQPTWIDRILSR